jgi:hypothetical protein
MKTITWRPGSNAQLDEEFENLRQIQFNNTEHRLWKNYSRRAFKFATALTIHWNDLGEPEMCSSIASRNCWPVGAYRILNRLWKSSNKINYPRIMSPSFAETAKSQIAWLKENTDCKLVFISRQTDNWENWVIKNFRDVYGMDFNTDNYKYLTCFSECNPTCWQKIIYNGDVTLLESWKKHQ